MTKLSINSMSAQNRVSFILSEEEQPGYYETALQLYRNGKYQEAKDLFTILTVSDIEERSYWMGLAASLQMLKEYEGAIECYSLAILHSPLEPMAHWHLAECYFATGNQSAALVGLKSAIEAARNHKTLQPLVDQLMIVQGIWERTK